MLTNSIDVLTILNTFTATTELRYTNMVDRGLLNLFVLSLLGAAFIKSAQVGPHI